MNNEFTDQAKPFLVARLYAGKITQEEFIERFEAAVRKDEKARADAAERVANKAKAFARAYDNAGDKGDVKKGDAAYQAMADCLAAARAALTPAAEKSPK